MSSDVGVRRAETVRRKCFASARKVDQPQIDAPSWEYSATLAPIEHLRQATAADVALKCLRHSLHHDLHVVIKGRRPIHDLRWHYTCRHTRKPCKTCKEISTCHAGVSSHGGRPSSPGGRRGHS